MTLVWVAFVLIFAVMQLCTAEHTRLWSENDLRQQSVTEPEPMSSPIIYKKTAIFNHFYKETKCLKIAVFFIYIFFQKIFSEWTPLLQQNELHPTIPLDKLP